MYLDLNAFKSLSGYILQQKCIWTQKSKFDHIYLLILTSHCFFLHSFKSSSIWRTTLPLGSTRSDGGFTLNYQLKPGKYLKHFENS
jgi:hypothetical protein